MSETTTNGAQVEQHSIGKSAFLHLLPAMIWIVFYIPLARLASGKGIPSMLVMLVTFTMVMCSFEVGYLYYQGKKKNGTLSLQGIVLYRGKMPWWKYIFFTVILTGWAILVYQTGVKITEFMSAKIFYWIPDWYWLNRGSVEQNSAAIEIAMAVLALLIFGVVGVVAEELYFRGYLLPRLSKLGKWAPLFNVALLISYHFWQPHMFVISIIGMLPWVYIVWWKRNIYLSLLVHGVMNLAGNIPIVIDRLNSM
jgi:membrane protease YdiL (CAAX protease family)